MLSINLMVSKLVTQFWLCVNFPLLKLDPIYFKGAKLYFVRLKYPILKGLILKQ